MVAFVMRDNNLLVGFPYLHYIIEYLAYGPYVYGITSNNKLGVKKKKKKTL